jgi:hypothetical protein
MRINSPFFHTMESYLTVSCCAMDLLHAVQWTVLHYVPEDSTLHKFTGIDVEGKA